MAALGDATQPLSNILSYDQESVVSIPVAGGETIYRGTLVCYDTADEATPADDTGPTAGVAIETVANTTAQGGGTDRDKFVKVAKIARVVLQLATTPVSTDVNVVVYQADSQSVTKTAGTNKVGRIVEFEYISARNTFTAAVVVQLHPAS